jgi:hypothetical protein
MWQVVSGIDVLQTVAVGKWRHGTAGVELFSVGSEVQDHVAVELQGESHKLDYLSVISAIVATVAGTAILVAALQMALSLTRERYRLEIGEVQSQLESAETLRPPPSQVSVHFDQLISDLTEQQQGQHRNIEQIREEVGDLVKAEVGKQRQAEDQRAELTCQTSTTSRGWPSRTLRFS